MALTERSGPETLYQWKDHQAQVHECFEGEFKEAQTRALETDLEKIQAKSDAVPPGYYAQLELLYFSIGKDDQMVREFKTEKILFPESATYMDFLLNNARGGVR